MLKSKAFIIIITSTVGIKVNGLVKNSIGFLIIPKFEKCASFVVVDIINLGIMANCLVEEGNSFLILIDFEESISLIYPLLFGFLRYWRSACQCRRRSYRWFRLVSKDQRP